MQLPFSTEQFLDLFAHYNSAIWPAQIVAYIWGVAAVALAVWPSRHSSRMISGILAAFWLWTGIVFLATYYRELNGMTAVVFGMLLAVQGCLFLYVGVVRHKLEFAALLEPRKIVGALFIFYALIAYPILGSFSGHTFPHAPVFGVAPCPTTIFTFGILLWSNANRMRYVLVIPFLWSVIGVGAALALGIYEDAALPLAGIVGTLLLLRPDRSETPSQHPSRAVAV